MGGGAIGMDIGIGTCIILGGTGRAWQQLGWQAGAQEGAQDAPQAIGIGGGIGGGIGIGGGGGAGRVTSIGFNHT